MSLANSINNQPSNSKKVSHVRVSALAGTGKTTTICDLALNAMYGNEMPFEPSQPQADVITEVNKFGRPRNVIFVAFSKAIQLELADRVPQGVETRTLHSLGFKVIASQVRLKRSNAVNSWKVCNLLSEFIDQDMREWRKDNGSTFHAIEDLVKFIKVNLLPMKDWTNFDVLDELCSTYNIELNGDRDYVYEMTDKILHRTLDGFEDDKYIDFNDMIWIPVMKKYPVAKFDLMFIDESQDLNKCQQELALMAGERIIMVGDENQAIFGFAGADQDSMDNFQNRLGDCVELPLNETRRCAKKVVKIAQELVPHFEAHEDNEEGNVEVLPFNQDLKGQYREVVEAGDMVLCRTNAPLVSECFKFLKSDRKANILGKDIGTNLIRLIEKMKAEDVGDLMQKLDDWKEKESQKESGRKNPNENRLIAIADKYECLIHFCEGAKSVESISDKIKAIFTDDKNVPGIKLASMHKSKGLEADNVFIIESGNATVPHVMAIKAGAREIKAEYRLLYVALTRAKSNLYLVSDDNPKSHELARQAGVLK